MWKNEQAGRLFVELVAVRSGSRCSAPQLIRFPLTRGVNLSSAVESGGSKRHTMHYAYACVVLAGVHVL